MTLLLAVLGLELVDGGCARIAPGRSKPSEKTIETAKDVVAERTKLEWLVSAREECRGHMGRSFAGMNES
jgi:hypothetical protein